MNRTNLTVLTTCTNRMGFKCKLKARIRLARTTRKYTRNYRFGQFYRITSDFTNQPREIKNGFIGNFLAKKQTIMQKIIKIKPSDMIQKKNVPEEANKTDSFLHDSRFAFNKGLKRSFLGQFGRVYLEATRVCRRVLWSTIMLHLIYIQLEYRRTPLGLAREGTKFPDCDGQESCPNGFQHPQRNSHDQELPWPSRPLGFGQIYVLISLFTNMAHLILGTQVGRSPREKITPRILCFVLSIIHFQVRDILSEDLLSQKPNHLEVIIVTIEMCQNFATQGKLVAVLLYFLMRRMMGKTTDEFMVWNFPRTNAILSRERVW